MRHSLKILPALLFLPAMTACTYGPQQQEFGYNGSSHVQHSGSYQTGGLSQQGDLICSDAGCAPGATYAVSNQASYDYSRPSHQPTYDANGSQVEGSYANTGYGHSPELRGVKGRPLRQGYKYGNLGGVNYDEGDEAYGLQARLGYQSAGILGAEVEGSFGISDNEDTVGTSSLKSGVDYSVGAFALARLPLAYGFSVHARGGYHLTGVSSELDNGVAVAKGSDDLDGFAYGGGAEYAFSPRSAIRLDYTRYETDRGDLDAISLGYAHKF